MSIPREVVNFDQLMKIFRSYLLWAGIAASVSLGAAHKFYFSRTLIRQNAQSGSLEIEMKLFTDDLERAINLGNEGERIQLGVDSTSSAQEQATSDYLLPRFEIEINDFPVSMRFWGIEVEHDITYAYLEIPAHQDIHSIRIKNAVFQDIFEDQINEIDLRLNAWMKRSQLTIEEPEVLITP